MQPDTLEFPLRRWRDVAARIFPILLLLAAVRLTSCSSGDPSDRWASGEPLPGILVPEPMVARDLDQIRESHTLRVLLRNSSSSYFILRGQEYGFEYELASQLAGELGVRLQVVLPDSQYSMLSQLNLGEVDLVAAPLIPDQGLGADIGWTLPYASRRQVLVVPRERAEELRSLQGLGGLMVAAHRWSAGERALLNLRSAGIPVGIVMLGNDHSTEEILDRVADGTYPAAVTQSTAAEAILSYRPELSEAFPLTEERWTHWAVRSNSPQLLARVDQFLGEHYRLRPDSSAACSEFYNVLHKKYFSDTRQIRGREEDPFRLARTGRVSPYDDLFREAGERYGFDWRLLASLSFEESSFDADIVSWKDAVGLMQLRPSTVGVSEDSLRIPELNIDLGVRHLRQLYDHYEFLEPRERLAFTLAAYNAGQGHLDDARMLSIIRGKDPNSWEGSVRESLLLLRKPEYHRLVRFGYVRGTETVAYVSDVLRRYAMLQRLMRDEVRPFPAAQLVPHAD